MSQDSDLMRQITWNSPENTKPSSSRWHRNYEALAKWYYKWEIEFNNSWVIPEEMYSGTDLMQTIPISQIKFNVPILGSVKDSQGNVLGSFSGNTDEPNISTKCLLDQSSND